MHKIQLSKTGYLASFGAMLLVVLFIYSLKLGAINISLMPLFQGVHLSDLQRIILFDVHMPRVISAAIIGAALAISGLLVQVVLKNDLASPSLLGISQGVALTDVILWLFFSHLGQFYYFVFSVLGGLITAFLIFGLTAKGVMSKTKLILAGIAVNTLLYALSHLLILLFPDEAQSVLFNINGSLMATNWQSVLYLLSGVTPVMIILVFLTHKLNILSLSDEVQSALGENIRFLKVIFILFAVILNAVAVSVSGPIFFFGLLIPQGLRLMGVHLIKARFYLCLIFGPIVLIAADSIIRYFFSTDEVPIGIIIGMISAPLFILLARVSAR
ncbi:FecCD family ABC transporter permease [Fangia hongkongensis]|uniref:FecCD family ABC transporter permease n=1 Tax=Fangia hongkongensis TaxID=270495 RepID=UPI00036F7838|nr:iron chelate uptake ABC transporter family permease subunit [Fangia hongkongensis]MBK2124522.1 iron chelate uptake ABC transporter family permease subunit [Fangia hongkongensis]